MLGIIVLSLDSMFVGLALGLFGVRKQHWRLAWQAVGFADLIALLLGRSLSSAVRPMTSSEQLALFTGCALAAIFLGRLCTGRPRVVILGMALLFSIDNLLAGSQSASLSSTALVAVATGISSCLACLAGLHVAAKMSSTALHGRPRLSLALAIAAVVAAFLAF